MTRQFHAANFFNPVPQRWRELRCSARSRLNEALETLQTFAGGGLPQNIPATSASLGFVTGVAVDSTGKVYLALQAYSAVVRVDAAGILTFYMGKNTAERKDYIMENLVVPVEE